MADQTPPGFEALAPGHSGGWGWLTQWERPQPTVSTCFHSPSSCPVPALSRGSFISSPPVLQSSPSAPANSLLLYVSQRRSVTYNGGALAGLVLSLQRLTGK